MSRIGFKPIEIPQGVEVKINEKNFAIVKGEKGQLEQQLSADMKFEIKDNIINVIRPTDNKRHKSLHGLTRSLLFNMIEGVTKGFEKKLELVGVGYRASKQGNKLILSLGFSHPVEMEDPAGITVEVPSQTEILIKGINKQQVGNYAAKIRELRKPEPYKGKGVRYSDEIVRRKVGKTG